MIKSENPIQTHFENKVQPIEKVNMQGAPTHLACMYTHPSTGAKLYASAALNYGSSEEKSVEILANLGVKTIVSFEASRDQSEQQAIKNQNADIRYINTVQDGAISISLSVDDFTVPIKAQIQATIKVINSSLDKGESIHLHCAGGTGRTPCFVGGFLMQTYNLSTHKVITKLRHEYSKDSVELVGQGLMLYCFETNKKYDANDLSSVSNIHFDYNETELTKVHSPSTNTSNIFIVE